MRLLLASVALVGAGALLGCGAATGNTASNTDSRTGVTEPSTAQSDEGPGTSGRDSSKPPSKVRGGRNQVPEVSFDELNCNMQKDVAFRPFMLTDRAQELDGQRIRIAGFMLPDRKQKGIEEFVLLKNTECKFGPGGQADHLIRVEMNEGVTATYTGDRPIEVTGRLKINPFSPEETGGITWSIYDMAGESIKTLRR